MKRHLLSSLLCVSALGGQLLFAQAAPVAAAATENRNVKTPSDTDALNQLKTQIADQQEQIKKLQQAVDAQQRMLEQKLNEATAASNAKTVRATSDGTAMVATSANSAAPVTLVPAVDTVKPDIVNKPRYMQKDESNTSPLGIKIGNSTFTPFGFIDTIGFGRSTNTGSGVGTSYASIPYNNALTDHISEQNISIQNTRLGLRVDSELKGAKVLGYLEMDFLGNQPTGIYQTSNSNVFRMRVAYVDITKGKFEFLAGQDWSFATANRKGLSPLTSDVFFSQAVDTNYQAALVWARQGQFRFIVHPTQNFAMGVSFENPQQFIGGGVTLPTALATPLATQLNNGATTYTAPNLFTDIIAKAAVDAKFLHLEVGGMVREFKIATGAGTPVVYTTHSANGYAGFFNGNLNLNNRARFFVNTFFGDGGGRYIGGTAPDLIVRANGSIAPAHQYSTTDGFEVNPTKSTLIYAYYSGSLLERDTALDANGKTLIGYGFQGSSLSDNKTIQEFTFGFAPTFWKSSTYGAFGVNLQYSYLIRDPWSIPAAGPKDAHTNIYYFDVRYTLP